MFDIPLRLVHTKIKCWRKQTPINKNSFSKTIRAKKLNFLLVKPKEILFLHLTFAKSWINTSTFSLEKRYFLFYCLKIIFSPIIFTYCKYNYLQDSSSNQCLTCRLSVAQWQSACFISRGSRVQITIGENGKFPRLTNKRTSWLWTWSGQPVRIWGRSDPDRFEEHRERNMEELENIKKLWDDEKMGRCLRTCHNRNRQAWQATIVSRLAEETK